MANAYVSQYYPNRHMIIRSIKKPPYFVILLFFVCGFKVAVAEPKTADGSVAIKKAQGLIRQLSQEKSALEAEKTAWLTEKTGLESKLKTLEETVKKLQPLQGEVEHYKTSLESTKSNLEGQLSQERQQKQNILQKHNDVIVKANAIHADNQLLVEAVKEREQWIEQCTGNNKKLHEANSAILKKYEEKSFFQQMRELEPITGIGNIETESTVEDYKYQLKQLQITPYKAKDSKTEAMPASETTNVPAATPEANQ